MYPRWFTADQKQQANQNGPVEKLFSNQKEVYFKLPYLFMFEQGILAFMGAASFQTHKLKQYLDYIFPSLYIFYLTALVVIVQYGTNAYFIFGYPNGVVYTTLTLFCPPKVQFLFIIGTPCILLSFANIFSLSYLHYVVFTVSSSALLGLVCYYLNNNKNQIYMQSIIIKNQQEIIQQFTSDNLLAISYDEQQRQFKLEFTNTSFENSYTKDIKAFLRAYSVHPDLDTMNQRKNKNETLEEYLYEANKQENFEENSTCNIKLKKIK